MGSQDLQLIVVDLVHDLREPLRTIRCYTELLAQPAGQIEDGDTAKLRRLIIDAAARMQRLLDDVPDLFLPIAPSSPAGPVNMQDALRVALSNLEVAIQESKAVITNDGLPTLTGKNGAWDRVFQNLIANAIKYRTEDIPRIHVGCSRSEAEWIFSVADNGIGIAPAYHQEIFLPLRRLHSRDVYPGSGLGLAICKRIVESQYGRIWLESAAGAGSTFYFTIPEIQRSILPASQRAQELDAGHGHAGCSGQSSGPWSASPGL